MAHHGVAGGGTTGARVALRLAVNPHNLGIEPAGHSNDRRSKPVWAVDCLPSKRVQRYGQSIFLQSSWQRKPVFVILRSSDTEIGIAGGLAQVVAFFKYSCRDELTAR
jgi:hypothetical protein